MKKIYTKPREDKKAERIAFLQKYAMSDWIKARQEADNEVSNECSIFVGNFDRNARKFLYEI